MNEFVFPFRVYVEDTDYGAVVYHANYLKYFERARSEWAESLGFGIEWQNEQKIYFAVRKATLDYLRPARIHQHVEVVSRISDHGKASITYDQYLRLRATPDTILCRGEIKTACVDHNLRPTALPDAIINFLGELA